MPSTKEYLCFVLEQLSGLEAVSYRPMMGEYIIYYRDRVAGGVFDDRLLVKPVAAARALMPAASYELPYDGAKPMLLVEEIDDREFMKTLFISMYDELLPPKNKKLK